MRDMTAGRPLKHMWAFAGPLMLSSLFSQLYTLADSMIVGRLLGTEAFAAIGAAGYLYGFASRDLPADECLRHPAMPVQHHWTATAH